MEITSGLPDDSREADERAAARALRDVRARVKAARAVAATTPGLADVLHRDWQKAARFYVRFGITETRFRQGPSADSVETGEIFEGFSAPPVDWMAQVRTGEAVVLPRGAHDDG